MTALYLDTTPREKREPQDATETTKPQRKRLLKGVNIPGGMLGILWLAIVVIPLYWVLVTSFRTSQDFFTDAPLSLPTNPTLGNYGKVFQSGFLTYFTNSVIVTLSAVVIILFVALLASYAIVRSNHPIAKGMFSVILLGLAIPLQAAIIPIFYMMTEAKLYDTLLALIIPSAAFAIPITVVIMTNFLRDIPGSLFESMTLDGATNWDILWRLVVPLARPALVTVAIYNGIQVWNGFLFPLVLTQSPQVRVLPHALWAFQSELTVDVPGVMAAVILSIVPILTLYIFGRRQLIAGLTAGFGK